MTSNGNSTVDGTTTTGPRPVVFCGPSGVGKGTLIEMLRKKYLEDKFGFSVSHTTRKPREGEVDGVHYNFTTVEQIKQDIDAGKFIEYAEVHGKYYGTSVQAVESVRTSGKICILDIDVQGVQNLKKSPLEPYYLFIAPPSMEVLEKRLRDRNTESEEDIEKRIGNAAGELEYGKAEGNFDKVLTNDGLDDAFAELLGIFQTWYPHLKGNGVEEVFKPNPLVFCGPSGVGKGTLIDIVKTRFPNDQFGFSVSHTTRKPREGEKDGVHYNFSTVDKMKEEIADGKFIEHAEVHGKFYGTSVAAVESVRSSGKVCILDIDYQGVQNVKKSSLNPLYIFIAPPSMEALESRLRARNTESEEDVKTRLGNAAKELEYGQAEGNFDRVFVNDDLKQTSDDLIEYLLEKYPHLDYVSVDDEKEPGNRICSMLC